MAEARNHCAPQNVSSNLVLDIEDFLTVPLEVVLANPVIRREFEARGILVPLGAPGAFNWLKGRLAPGSPTPTGCDIQTVPSNLLEPGVLETVPSLIGSFLTAIIGHR
ncbi:hypothetical protein ACFWPX_36840 [Nocardia sp. NPDC058518]|uniref:hypothetical protein n=1 Tax=Nocardia sp. NPDC058518 TaxID=3346534 RepID=UPI003652B72F